MMRYLMVVLLALLLVQRAANGAALTEEQFLAEYEPALSKLRQFYGSSTMSGVITRSERGKTAREHFSFFNSGDRMRLDLVSLVDADGGPVSGATKVHIAGPKQTLALRRDQDAKRYFVQTINESDSAEWLMRANYSILFAAYANRYGQDPITVLKLPGVTIQSIKEHEEGGESLVTVTFLQPITFRGHQPQDCAGSFVFDRHRCWAMRRYDLGLAGSDDPDLVTTIDYGDSIDGVPVMKRVEQWGVEKGLKVGLIECDIQDLRPTPAPPAQFTLAAFGLPNIAEAPPPSRRFLYATIGCIAFFLVALAFRWIAGRRKGSPTIS